MIDTKQFNPLPLLSVKGGLDSSLAQISAELENYFNAGWSGNEHLKLAHEELHRAVGVLQMLSLEGLAVFSKEFETVLQEMLMQQQAPTSLHRDTLRGAMLALTQYLDSLADGASNTALRLFYSYQELHQLRGLETAFEVDLFFPEFGVELPAEVLDVPLVKSAAESVKKARAQYQRALLKWLRQDNPAQSLLSMRAAVQTVMACAPQDQHRAFWWIATGLLDCLIHDGLPAELNANKLLARVDLQMKSMAEQKTRDTEYNTTCGMQYILARSHSVSETVDKIKQTYVLDSYLPEEQPLPYAEVVQVLEQMHSALTAAQETHEQCVKGDAECGKRFIEQLEELHNLSERLDKDTLQFLCKQMLNVVSDPDDADAMHRIKMEIAMSLLLLGSGIDRYQHLDARFHEQERMLVQCLKSESSIDAADENSVMSEITTLHCQMAEQEVLLPLATEMKGNLQQVELNLNVFFSDTSKRNELAPLRRLLTQVYGGLYLLALDTAKQLIGPVVIAVDRYVAGATPSNTEMNAIASAVSALENYVHGVSQGLKPDETSLKEVLRLVISDSHKADQKSVVQETSLPSGVSVREGGEDAELLEVFLEEAQEVLETLHLHLGACQRNPHSREDLVTIRRGFHTLKGSGRMVGLTNLGEVAWSVEKALNKWLQDEKPTTLPVLELIGDAEVLFQHWVEKLRSGATALIDATDLVAAAQRIESGVIEEKPSVAAKAVKEAELPDIVIGGVSLSPVLFNIATDEAASIIETLQRLVAELRKGEKTVIHYDFVRAAHTLAGVNRSTGFTDISDLAGALELWLQVCLDTMTPPDILQLNLLEQTINALAEMVNSLRRKQEPKPRPDLITRLQIKKKQLNKAQEEEKHKDVALQLESVQKNVAIAKPESPENEIHPLSDEDDLVAYVQRVAQEQANEPLQWQSPEEPANTEAKNTKKSRPEPEPVMSDVAPDNRLFSIDLDDLKASPAPQSHPDQEDKKSPDAEAFSFNFDDMDFAAETPKKEKAAEPEIQFNLNDFQPDANQLGSALDEVLAEPYSFISETASLDEINAHLRAQPSAGLGEVVPEDAHESKKRAIQDDLDEQLLPIFLEEADELYPQLTSELSEWRSNVDDAGEGLKIARKLQRSLHTLKGSARMAGAMRLGELTHRVEDCLDAAVAEGKHDSALLDELEGYFDRIGSALEKLRTGDTSVEAVEQVAKVVAPKKNVVQQPLEQLVESNDERKEAAILRVRSDVVDNLVNEAGEISVARSRMEVELSAFKGGLHDLTSSVLGMRKLVREIEMHAEGQMQARSAVAGDSAEKFDPLEFDRFTRFQELTRFMSESVHDVHTVQQSLLKNLDETSAAMSAQAKLNSILQKSLMSIRMLPFSNISQRLYRIVRQTGKELGKKANLELYGTEIELDRGVLEKMTAPFEHLLRNAIVHGLESPEQRELKGKPPIGNIALTLRQAGNEVVFEFKDDGAGLNTVKIRQKAVEQGLIQATEIISDEKAMLLIFETGLSTATELTEISGRGVGMDVVRSEIKALGGRVEVSSEPDKGASFTIYLPLTLAVMKALMVRAGNEIYAIPSVMVEQVQQVKPDVLVELYRNGSVSWQDKPYPLYYLPQLLGDKERVPDNKVYNSILLLRSGEQRIAIHLDELLGNKEVVVKNVGVQLARLPGIAGATVQANGKVVLILNPVPLIQETKEVKRFDTTNIQAPLRKVPVVMIVDDSLTVRKITTRLLTRAGYEVVTAKDGVDALEKLVDMTPDIMLLDVEMPRMDGFELTKQLRRDSKTVDLPIIMITSRTADKHKNYAYELGVNGYLGKPYQDDELLENIAQYAPLLESAPSL